MDKAIRELIFDYMKRYRYGVVSTVCENGAPEAAFVGFAVTAELELIFETLVTTRKYANILRDGRVAAVVGWDENKTLQYEGLADEPNDEDREALKSVYYAALPENRSHEGWPGLTYVRVRPHWIRISNYGTPWSIDEYKFDR